MKLITAMILFFTSTTSVNAVPIPGAAQLESRDGSTEFDTDLCVLKRAAAKRGDVIGMGIDDCDF
ncbi:hypothetical protein F4821DRAFT_248244 [Hypoxylon rubiginosum]|uniref:Uncharacterized protein n=1 Tax=Hypoxylon rubiginosum TaxID=110542 RepID=A0ACC0CNG2_9PEZI|nr:hypothetical protein F4821DRAFT_248244 [Hypoxylon rubiginosum]